MDNREFWELLVWISSHNWNSRIFMKTLSWAQMTPHYHWPRLLQRQNNYLGHLDLSKDLKSKSRKIQSRIRKRPNALARILSQNNGSPLISNRRRSRCSLSLDHATSLENNDVVHDHVMHEPDSAFEENHAFILTKPKNPLSNEKNENGVSKWCFYPWFYKKCHLK